MSCSVDSQSRPVPIAPTIFNSIHRYTPHLNTIFAYLTYFTVPKLLYKYTERVVKQRRRFIPASIMFWNTKLCRFPFDRVPKIFLTLLRSFLWPTIIYMDILMLRVRMVMDIHQVRNNVDRSIIKNQLVSLVLLCRFAESASTYSTHYIQLDTPLYTSFKHHICIFNVFYCTKTSL